MPPEFDSDEIISDLESAPLTRPVTPKGFYILEIKNVDKAENNSSPGKFNLVLDLEVVSDGNGLIEVEGVGDKLKMWIGLDDKTGLKRAALAAGIDISQGMRPKELVGKTVKAYVTNKQYKDKDTGELKNSSNVKEFILP